MKQKLFTLLTLLLCLCSTAWADDDPTLTIGASAQTTETFLKEYATEGITISSTEAYSSGCVQLGSDGKYLEIVATSNIEKVSFFMSGNGSNKTLNPIAFGWAGDYSATADTYVLSGTQTTSANGYAYAKWFDFDFSSKDLKRIRLYKQTKNISSTDPAYTGSSTGFPSSTQTLKVYGIKVWLKSSDTRDPLTLNFSATGSTNIAVNDELATMLTWDENTSAESAKYTISYKSSNEDVATVDAAGVVKGVALGSATITATVTADADATYKTTKANITVNVIAPWTKHENFTTPTSVLDFTDADAASAALTVRWFKDNPYYGNDGEDNYVVVSPYTVYQGYSTSNSTSAFGWASSTATGNSGTDTWSQTDVFLGSTYYTQESSKARYAAQRQDRPANYYCYRVKGVSKVKLLYKSNGTINLTLGAFEITAGAAASTTMLYTRGKNNSASVLTLDGLDPSKEYLITTDNSYNNTSTTNISLYELAFFYDSSVDIAASITPAKQYTTYVTNDAIDFTGLGLKAFVATNATASTVTLEPVTAVPARTPLILKGTAATEYKIPVIAPVEAPADNLLLAGDGTTTIGGNENFDYILSDGKFYRAESGTIAVGKAYLHLDAAPAAASRELSIIFEGETTGINTIENSEFGIENSDAPMYNLAGQRVTKSYKGVVIVNGKKMLNK